MNRALTFLAATTCATIAVTATCFAAELSSIPFELSKARDANHAQLSMEHRQDGSRSGNWSQQVAMASLTGLGSAQFAAPAKTPIRFALVRPAGRFDCTGSARSYSGSGTCAFAADAAFSTMLERRGIGRPSIDQSYKLAMSGFDGRVLDALTAAGYPRPTIEQTIALGIFDIEPTYVRGLADAGYRLGTIDDLVGFKIHKVTPELIRAYRGLGYRQLSADELMAMAIHKVTPEFIRGFAALGYRDLPGDKLVQLRIFNVTPDDVRALQAQGIALPSADQLVRLRLAGFGPKRRGK